MHRFRSIPGVLCIIGIALILGVIITNTVITVGHPGGGSYRSYTSHSLRVALGSVVIVGLVLIAISIVWFTAKRRARRSVRVERSPTGQSSE